MVLLMCVDSPIKPAQCEKEDYGIMVERRGEQPISPGESYINRIEFEFV